MAKQSEVRLGVVGCGGMAHYHMEQFKDVHRMKFVAASDTSTDNLKRTIDKYHVKGFADASAMMDSGLIDAVLIATPHYFHPVYAKEAFKRNLHVLTEKPVTVTAKAAAEVNKLRSRRKGLVYAAMYQMRTDPKWRKVRELIVGGEVGALQRMQWTATYWFRTDAYYKSGSWRATWAGEGGGVLLNQCPHNLDMLYWLLGQPKRVHAHVALGKHHAIEVEDEVTAFMEFPNGATGVFITSTGEYPGADQLEIVGDRGRLLVNSTNTLEFIKTDASVSHYSKTTHERFVGPGKSRILFEMGDGSTGGSGSHKDIQQNFVNAILDGEPLIAPAEEGLHSVELANAMIYSGLTGKPVDLPMNRDAYEKLLAKLIKASKAK